MRGYPIPSISTLLRTGSPSTISGLVVSVIVNPVNRMLRARFFPHIGKEINKRFSPPLAYGDSPSSPIGESRIFDVVASRHHRRVGRTFRRWLTLNKLAVNAMSVTTSQVLSSGASATESRATKKFRSIGNHSFSAVALAHPFRSAVINDGQPSIFSHESDFSNKIRFIKHKI
jgi:hypothetical protein